MHIDHKDLIKRIVQISYDNHLSHLGSCISALPIIESIYNKKKLEDKFILSAGHAGLALFTVLEKHYRVSALGYITNDGIHPQRSTESWSGGPMIDCSTGSLGQGLPISIGMALADPSIKVYCLISDGECGEGSIWESLRIIDELKITNIKVHCNINGYGAYREIEKYVLANKLKAFLPDIVLHYTSTEDIPHLSGLNAHYKVLGETEYLDILRYYEELK